MTMIARRFSQLALLWLALPASRPASAQVSEPCDPITCRDSGRGCCDPDGNPVTPAPPEASSVEPQPQPQPAPAPAMPADAPQMAADSSPPLAVEEDRLPEPSGRPRVQRTLHGFRLGYMYVHDFDRKLDPEDPESSLEGRVDMKSPHLFLLGYEVTRRLIGHSWLNIILVGNVMVGGLEQSKFYPSANALIGFEIDESFQIGVGPNLAPDPDKVAHILFAGGWTPRVGSFNVPVHGFYIPDVDGIWRTGMTLGVNW